VNDDTVRMYAKQPKAQEFWAMPLEDLRLALRDPKWGRDLTMSEYAAAQWILRVRSPRLIF